VFHRLSISVRMVKIMNFESIASEKSVNVQI
jgi:hypothetical protein